MMIIEAEIIAYLSEKISAPVFAEIPDNLPDEFVIVNKLTQDRKSLIFESSVDIYSYSTSKANAAVLDAIVQAALLPTETSLGILQNNGVMACTLGGGGNAMDTQIKRHSYDSIFNFVHS